MAFLQRWLLLVGTLLMCAYPAVAASPKEERALAAAITSFQDEMWARAETQLEQFVKKYPDSAQVPQARLLQAQAEFKQQSYSNVIELLTTNLPVARSLADQFAYWIAEAHFQSGDYSAAATAFNSLLKTYPESSLRPRAVVGEASALAKLNEWERTAGLLEATNGVFQRALKVDPTTELVARGRLLLARTKFVLKDFSGAATVLDAINPQILPPSLAWQRLYLLCQVRLATGDLDAALTTSTNLIQAVRLTRDTNQLSNLSESLVLRAEILEKLGRTREALAAYRENLTNGAPVEVQQQAILKVAALAAGVDQIAEATNALETFLVQYSNAPPAATALLTLGELQLRTIKDGLADTNQLAGAQACFDRFLQAFPDSPLVGKAHLDRGWCFWLAGKIPESAADFKAAVEKLPRSEDLAVAKFKLGDALFAEKDFSGALENYLAVWEDFADFPNVANTLGDRALYQSLRADLELGDLDSAHNILMQIEKNYAGGPALRSTLLFGESWAELRSPSGARAQFAGIAKQYPDSPLLPQVALAVAHTYALEKDWPEVITNYGRWLVDFPTNALRMKVAYALAQANYQAGDETNALKLFVSFVAQFPTNKLAPSAQWWVADYYFRAGDWPNAERNYKFIFQNPDWRNSPLIWPAQMMAGRAALGRLGYQDAIGYFTGLAGDTNCPPELVVPARFAYGSALMLMNSPDTNNPMANFQQATNVFIQLAQANPTNEWGARALIEAGNCDLQMNNFDAATNVYEQVFNSPYANVAARSQAQIGFGIALEKKAALATGGDQAALLKMARDNYLDVFDTVFGTSLRADELADPFWVKKAGLQALPLVESFGMGNPDRFISKMEELLPQLTGLLEKKRSALPVVKK